MSPRGPGGPVVLAGDVGGTKTLLGRFVARGGHLEPLAVERFASADHDSLEELVEAFLGGDPPAIDAACLAVAGPVVDGTVEATNLAWSASQARLAEQLELPRLELVNDLVATAEALPDLEDVAEIVPGDARESAPRLVVAAGTGFGASLRLGESAGGECLPTEAGHMSFAPHGEEQEGFARHLRERHDRASVERAVSGPGIVEAYEYLGTRGAAPDDDAFARRWETDDRAELVTEYALRRDSRRARGALDLFLSCYGAVTGDLALATLALGGVFVGGGIAPKIEASLRDGVFRAAFSDKGRMRELVERIPVLLIREPRAALLGAARRASRACA